MKYIPITKKPEKIGQYPIHIQGVRSSSPVYLDYDGENWIGLDEIIKDEAEGDIKNIVYMDNHSLLELNKPKFTF